jgi:hypothetical protein
MPEMTLEVTVCRAEKRADVWRDKPAYGRSHEPRAGALWRGVLNNGQVRVKIGVYGELLTLPELQMIARIAVSEDCPIERW